ncbi:expressed unknown protein [Seminavis robusta]|uniref:Uncharacterized protein n=1 Tax=Seminavis robusta TaxID=568900 RepID=A0A9N8HJZ7_9STRA|nr:expressed unknown protein [Seminavis robusta]|eukprot:Sro901_g217970.1 n/a (256) ;mRNA; f:10163-11025
MNRCATHDIIRLDWTGLDSTQSPSFQPWPSRHTEEQSASFTPPAANKKHGVQTRDLGPGVLEACWRAFQRGSFSQTFPAAEVQARRTRFVVRFLLEDKNIPGDPQRGDQPCLLVHDLENPSHKEKTVYKHIEANKGSCIGLYGTSGVGKTRSTFEYLSHNFGLYFVASTRHDAGSSDLENLLIWFKRLVYVRNVVYAAMNEQLKKKGQPCLTPYQWLLIQLYPEEALGWDLFDVVHGELTAGAVLNPEDKSIASL